MLKNVLVVASMFAVLFSSSVQGGDFEDAIARRDAAKVEAVAALAAKVEADREFQEAEAADKAADEQLKIADEEAYLLNPNYSKGGKSGLEAAREKFDAAGAALAPSAGVAITALSKADLKKAEDLEAARKEWLQAVKDEKRLRVRIMKDHPDRFVGYFTAKVEEILIEILDEAQKVKNETDAKLTDKKLARKTANDAALEAAKVLQQAVDALQSLEQTKAIQGIGGRLDKLVTSNEAQSGALKVLGDQVGKLVTASEGTKAQLTTLTTTVKEGLDGTGKKLDGLTAAVDKIPAAVKELGTAQASRTTQLLLALGAIKDRQEATTKAIEAAQASAENSARTTQQSIPSGVQPYDDSLPERKPQITYYTTPPQGVIYYYRKCN